MLSLLFEFGALIVASVCVAAYLMVYFSEL